MGQHDDAHLAAVDGLFLNTDIGPAHMIEVRPKGKAENPALMIPAVIDAAHLIGSNETRGDGVVNEKRNGNSIRESITIEVRFDAPISDIQSRLKPDRIILPAEEPFNGDIFKVKRMLGKDHGMKAFVCVRVIDTFKVSPSVRG